MRAFIACYDCYIAEAKFFGYRMNFLHFCFLYFFTPTYDEQKRIFEDEGLL